MAAHFRKKGLPVPEVYICSEDKNCYLQEDLGDILLFNAIEKGGRPASSPKRRKKCCARPSAYCLPSNLPEQTALIFTLLSPSRIQPTFYPWDLNYFKYCFLKATGLEFQEDKLEDDFQKMSDVLLRSSSATFMYRDFQSRNVMIRMGHLGSLISREDVKDRFSMT